MPPTDAANQGGLGRNPVRVLVAARRDEQRVAPLPRKVEQLKLMGMGRQPPP